VSQALKFGTLSLQLSEHTPAQLLSSFKISFPAGLLNPPSPFLLASQIQPLLTIVRVYTLYLFTYLVTYLLVQHSRLTYRQKVPSLYDLAHSFTCIQTHARTLSYDQ